MLDLAARLNLGGVRWIAPYADAGKWYPRRFWDTLASNEPYLSRAVERCDEMVEEAGESGRLDPRRLAVIGFSQGACVAVEYALRHPDRCGSIVAFTGCLMGPPGTVWRPAAGKTLEGLRILLTGSDADDWVPERNTRETAQVLEQLGAEVQLRVYPGRPHIVSEEEIVEARVFLDQRR